MFDINDFKMINDEYSHAEGDKALIAFSGALREILLSKDAVAARWGGDEFVVAGKEKELSDNFREWLSDALKDNKSINYELLFSTGAYVCTTPGMTCEQVLKQADDVLYKDKEERHKNTGDYVSKLMAVKNNGK